MTAGFNIEARRRHDAHYVDVNVTLRSKPLVRIVSSRRWRARLSVDFPQEVRERVAERRAQGGAAKGRVLYIVVQSRYVLGVLWYHMPRSGPLEIMGVAAAGSLEADQEAQTHAWLIACAQAISEACGRPAGELAWVTNHRSTLARARSLGFRPATRPGHCNLRHYLLLGNEQGDGS